MLNLNSQGKCSRWHLGLGEAGDKGGGGGGKLGTIGTGNRKMGRGIIKHGVDEIR